MKLEFAWAVGVFEGEGSLITAKRPNRARVMRLRMTDRDVVERFAAAVGVGHVYGPYEQNGRKSIWCWQVSRWRELEPLLVRMLPMFCKRRRVAAIALLADGRK